VNHARKLPSVLIVVPPVPENRILTEFPASITFLNRSELSSIFKAVELPVVASTSIPLGQPMKIELKIEIAVFLRICTAPLNNELPVLV